MCYLAVEGAEGGFAGWREGEEDVVRGECLCVCVGVGGGGGG